MDFCRQKYNLHLVKNSALHKKASSQNRTLALVIISIVIISIVTVMGFMLSRRYILKQAELRIQAVMMEAESLHDYVQIEMHPAMYQLKKEGRLPEEFYSPEMLSSSYITRHVFRLYNQIRKKNHLPLVEYRMASKNPRNQINQADSLETRLIDMFNQDTTLKKYIGITTEHHEKHLYYAKPFLRIEPQCLKCHGSKENAPDDLRDYYNWDH